MTPDYTINDAFKDGFECGLLYVLRYAKEVSKQHIDTNDIAQLVIHLEQKKPWKSDEEWEALILNNLNK